jgi:hypothetical protein
MFRKSGDGFREKLNPSCELYYIMRDWREAIEIGSAGQFNIRERLWFRS